jgi:uncharacterized coiled-coil protein SlyX
VAQLAAAAGAADTERSRAEELAETLAQLQASVAMERDSLAAAERKLANASSRAGTLAARVAEQEQTIADLRGSIDAAPAPRWADATAHLVFVRGADGYELVERSGPPPAVGAVVEGGTVGRIGAAPWPGVELPCAYLVD